MNDFAYLLRRDVNHLVDAEQDAWLLDKFEGYANVSFGLQRSYEDVLPAPIRFGTTFDLLAWNDYPSTDVKWPIMSQKMLRVLQSVGEFEHRTIPVIMLDKRLARGVAGQAVPLDAENHDYMVVQLLEHLEAFDWEASTYTPHPRLPNYVRRVQKLHLKTPSGGFPPLFRLTVSPAYLFVSAAAKLALEAAKVGGVQFIPLPDVRL